MNTLQLNTMTREQTLEQLLRWLPGVYRSRDAQGHLRAYLSLFADELWRLRQLLARQYDDLFIDTAQDWVLPYLADLVGTDLLYPSSAAMPNLQTARRNRDDIKNTLRWRRQKGTLSGLQDLAQHVSGWGVHAVEMFERSAWLQNLNHIKPGAAFALDLRQGEALARVHTPFSSARRLVDLRPVEVNLPRDQGRGGARALGIFHWPIAAHPLRGITPFALGGGRFYFDALGRDCALYAACEDEAQRAAVLGTAAEAETTPILAAGASGASRATADIAHVNSTDVPLRNRDLNAHGAAYVGTPLGFTLYEDGIALVGPEPSTSAVSPAPASLSPASLSPATGWVQLAQSRGLIAADVSAYAAGTQLELAAVRLGAATQLVNGVLAPIAYNPGQPWAAQFALRSPAGRVQLNNVTPDFSYTPAVLPYQPDSGEFHRDYLLLALSNLGAADVTLPQHEVIVRNTRGLALQVALPVVTLAAGATMHWYVAQDGATYYARADHQAGDPDRNPDDAVFGAFSAAHLARASEGQRRIRAGHPAGAARFRRVLARDLCCWEKPLVPALNPGQIAVDATRGRFAFAAGDEPSGELRVDYHYGRTGEIGAGPFAREQPPALLTVARDRDAQFSSVQAALDAAPEALPTPVVIEILDSAVYEEALLIDGRNFPGGLILQAAALQTPLLRKPAAATQLVRVQNSAISLIKFSGLTCTGGAVQIQGAGNAIQAVHWDHCTLEPASVALLIDVPHVIDVAFNACISGALTLNAPTAQVFVSDSVIQHPAAQVETPNAGSALAAVNARLELERCSVLGTSTAQSARVSNSVLLGAFTVTQTEDCCLRYSRLPAPWPARGFQCSSAMPIFISLQMNHAGYAHLHPNSAAALLSGGEEGAQMGAFATAALPWRLNAMRRRIDEYIPAGLRPMTVAVLPRQRLV